MMRLRYVSTLAAEISSRAAISVARATVDDQFQDFALAPAQSL